MPFESERDAAIELALRAGELARGLQDPSLAVDRKADDSPVTRADREASALILDGLAARFPTDALLSEEAPDDGGRRTAARVWMIDPIDGTNDFIRGASGYAVMIGLCVDARPVVGVVYQPVGERLYWAAAGAGAFTSLAGGAQSRVQVRPVAAAADARLVASRSHRTHDIDRVRERLGIHDEINVGSVGLKLGLIARGERDLYVNPSSRSSVWDTCAPEIILTEAGGKLTDLSGAPLDYAADDVGHHHGLIGACASIHDEVVAKLAVLFPRKP